MTKSASSTEFTSAADMLAESARWCRRHPIRYAANCALRQARGASREVRWAYQRVVRGWDDRALWSLDYHLAKTLGAQLIELSRIAHGYPSDQTYEQWTAVLAQHGQALKAYADDDLTHCDTTYPPAKVALVWVAENLGSLWD